MKLTRSECMLHVADIQIHTEYLIVSESALIHMFNLSRTVWLNTDRRCIFLNGKTVVAVLCRAGRALWLLPLW